MSTKKKKQNRNSLGVRRIRIQGFDIDYIQIADLRINFFAAHRVHLKFITKVAPFNAIGVLFISLLNDKFWNTLDTRTNLLNQLKD